MTRKTRNMVPAYAQDIKKGDLIDLEGDIYVDSDFSNAEFSTNYIIAESHAIANGYTVFITIDSMEHMFPANHQFSIVK